MYKRKTYNFIKIYKVIASIGLKKLKKKKKIIATDNISIELFNVWLNFYWVKLKKGFQKRKTVKDHELPT